MAAVVLRNRAVRTHLGEGQAVQQKLIVAPTQSCSWVRFGERRALHVPFKWAPSLPTSCKEGHDHTRPLLKSFTPISSQPTHALEGVCCTGVRLVV